MLKLSNLIFLILILLGIVSEYYLLCLYSLIAMCFVNLFLEEIIIEVVDEIDSYLKKKKKLRKLRKMYYIDPYGEENWED